jgi:hypothetical protein
VYTSLNRNDVHKPFENWESDVLTILVNIVPIKARVWLIAKKRCCKLQREHGFIPIEFLSPNVKLYLIVHNRKNQTPFFL